MALSNEMSAADIAAVTGNGYNNGFGDGNGWWIILFLILAMGGNWGNNGFGGGGNSVPWFMNTDSDVERGFDQMSTMNGIGNLQTTVSNGFANAATQLCSGLADVEQGANARQMANMNQMFGLQTSMMQGFNGMQSQFADCCCENRLGIANLANVVQTENCADRQALNEGVRDIIASQTAGTQRILDQLCADKIDAKNDEIAQLRQEVLFARGQASQVTQNANIINGVYDALSKCPVGTVPVYGEQPIFSCPTNVNNGGCGCNGF